LNTLKRNNENLLETKNKAIGNLNIENNKLTNEMDVIIYEKNN
jgi:hypothetical protein